MLNPFLILRGSRLSVEPARSASGGRAASRHIDLCPQRHLMPSNASELLQQRPAEGILNQAGRSWEQSSTGVEIVPLPGREAGSLRAAKGRVLIVEDDPLIASLVAMIMESELACESVTAHSVAKAADLMDTPTSLGVLDVEVGDGLTFPLALQLLAREIPCVFVSGSDPARIPPALARTPFLRKPVSSRDLTAAARQLLAIEPDAIAADRARRTPLLIAEGFPDLASMAPRFRSQRKSARFMPVRRFHTRVRQHASQS